MSVANASAPRRPTVLVLRAPGAPDELRATLATAVGYHGHVRALEFAGTVTAAGLSDAIAKHLSGQDVVLYAEGAAAAAALAVDAPPLRRVVALDPPKDAVIQGRPADIILQTGDVSTPALERTPGVRIHRPSPGVSSHGEELERLIIEVVREACRRTVVTPVVFDEPLLHATPLVEGELGYLGPEGDAFAGAYVARRPGARAVVLTEDAASAPLDILVLGAPVDGARLSKLAGQLKPGGWLVARWCAAGTASKELADKLAAAGLQLADPVDHGGTGVFRAQRAAGPPPRPFLVAFNAISPWMMDIRTRLPVQQMASDPDLAMRYLVPLRSIPPAPVDQPKVVVMQRPARYDVEGWRSTMARFIVRGWVCVMEFDDHPYLIAEVGGAPPTEDLLIRLGFVHGVQTSVEPLAEAFRPYNPEVTVFPNTAFDLLPFADAPRPRRVFYGATPRGELPAAVAASLAPVVERFPDLEFVVVGSQAVFDALPTERKTLHPYLSYEAYLAVMASCSVSLAPIDALPMRDTKSDAKYLDASRAGVLTIASPTIYARTIRHGETGLIAETLEDWPRLLTQVLAEPDWARGIARHAWDDVRANRMFADQIAVRKAWYRQLWDRREELTERVMERLPGLREEVASLR